MEYIKEIITSSQNKYVSLVRGLANKKMRESERLFRFDGVKLFCEAVRKGVGIDFILVSENERYSVMEKAEKLYGITDNDIDCRVMTVSDQVFSKLSEEHAPEGVICVAKYMNDMHCEYRADVEYSTPKEEKILLLESVRDPQNIGAIARVSAAFGVDRIVMSLDCADIYNPKTLRASMGAIFATRIDRVADMPLAIKEITRSGRRVFAAALNKEAHVLGEIVLKTGDCVIIGNEGHGLSDAAVEACGRSVYIPMADHVESLNAATAAAVLVWEFFGSPRKGGLEL